MFLLTDWEGKRNHQLELFCLRNSTPFCLRHKMETICKTHNFQLPWLTKQGRTDVYLCHRWVEVKAQGLEVLPSGVRTLEQFCFILCPLFPFWPHSILETFLTRYYYGRCQHILKVQHWFTIQLHFSKCRLKQDSSMLEDKLKHGDYFPPDFIVCEKNVQQAFS